MTKKIAFFELEDWKREYVKKHLKLKGYKIEFFDKEIGDESIRKTKDAEIIAPFVYSECTNTVLRKLPKLKYIATMSTGYDHIDLATCKKAGIKVSNVPSYGSNTVAEHAFGLILTLSRKLHEAINRTEHDNFSLDGLRGFDLRGKTIGVVGTGKIGSHVIRMANGFEMKVIAYDPHPKKEVAKQLGFKYTSFNELLKKSDIITLHVPLTPETKHMISKKNINKIKRGAYLINTARGDIVETEALFQALNSGILAGAGLDVLEGEDDLKDEAQLLHEKYLRSREVKDFIENHLMIKKENVIVTAHNAFNTKEALQRILDTTIENIQAFVRGKPINLVN